MSDITPPLQHADDSKKRTRVSPSQLAILEETFNVSATPDSKMRKQLAQKLEMPERSIQIWFQNRRAKVKMLQRRALLRQEQDVARARLCAEATSQRNNYGYWYPPAKLPIHRAWSSDMIHPPAIPPPPPPPPTIFQHPFTSNPPTANSNNNDFEEDIYSLTVSPSTPQSFSVPRRLESEPLQQSHLSSAGLITATAVTIGSWHRMKINQQDLMCYYKLSERAFSWHIRDSSYHFKMMISFDIISNIELNVLEDNISAQIDIDLIEPPIFFMENSSGTWVQCSDFTEGMQASCVLRHIMRGLASDLRQELLGIASMDERLCQITQFSVDHFVTASTATLPEHHSIDPSFMMPYQHWRHQSLPLSAKEYVVPPPYIA
ncbi:homeobox-domain-containing protein [Backusella circina FSU 941]|nr:homeobox-domain-containing protein [Backusella circina FSU 941]